MANVLHTHIVCSNTRTVGKLAAGLPQRSFHTHSNPTITKSSGNLQELYALSCHKACFFSQWATLVSPMHLMLGMWYATL